MAIIAYYRQERKCRLFIIFLFCYYISMNEKLNAFDSRKKSSSEARKFSEHLIEGVSPIVACVGSLEDFLSSEIFLKCPKTPIDISNSLSLSDLKNIDWLNGTYGSKEGEDVLTAGPRGYVISAIDNSNKFSLGFGSCTGLIVAGIDKETGENISFITHQPSFNSTGFADDFEKRLQEMKNRCKFGTIDAIIVGGGISKEYYIRELKLFLPVMQRILGFQPIVINGPKVGTGKDDIYYDNKHRRLYFLRPEVNKKTESFVSDDIEEEKSKWK